MTRIVHVSLGPVQDFIAAARRTRDLWAGSFLLSWLSGHAMKAVTEGKGTILSPAVAGDALYNALHKRTVAGADAWPLIGSLPNRFSAELPDGVAATVVETAVRSAWERLAATVWGVFVQDLANPRTRTIWDRQVRGYWTVAWAFQTADPTHDVLAARKHWRTTALPGDEGGDHCTVMGDWQELSGLTRAKGQAKDQDAFWDAVRDRIAHVVHGTGKKAGTLELRRSERLCAIAFVKRVFPLLPLKALDDAIGWVPDRPYDPGRQSDHQARCELRKYPSTAYMAAVPWMVRAMASNADECLTYARRVEGIWPDAAPPGLLTRAERHSAVKSLAGTPFGHLDGTLLFEEGIARRRAEMRRNRPADDDGEAGHVRELTDALKALQKATAPTGGRRQRKMTEASPFYAVLLMDGDGIGALLRDHGARVGPALAAFTGRVRGIVRDADGLLIYAGGDDVLALLPIHTALATAEALALAFRDAFRDNGFDPPPTISAGLVVAHCTHPLGDVMRMAHAALDDTAKDGNGRDSLAIVVAKRGGAAAEWVSAWDLGDGVRAVGALRRLVRAFAEDDERSSSFLHNLSERYGAVLTGFGDQELETNLLPLLLAERLKGRDLARSDAAENGRIIKKAKDEMTELAAVCRPRHATTNERRFTVEGAMVVRFLADNGGWFRGEPS